MKRRQPGDIAPSEITPYDVYLNRRSIVAAMLAGSAVSLLPALGRADDASSGQPLQYKRNTKYSVKDPPNSFEDITSYNNFYEFGTDKADPRENAGSLRTRPCPTRHRCSTGRSRAVTPLE